MKLSKNSPGWLCVILLAIVAVACAPAATPLPAAAPTAAPAAGASTPSLQPTPTPRPAPAPAPAVSRGGILTLRDAGSFNALEPILSSLPANPRVAAPMYSRLLSLGKDDDLLPMLAKDWTITQNGTVFTFNLRDDVQFHDGKPLTAADVVYSFDMTLTPPKGTVSINKQVFDPVIAKVEALNPQTVRITTKRTSGWFLGHVPIVTIVPKHAHELVAPQGGFTNTGLGSGPFKFQSWTPKLELILSANKSYFKRDLPYLDEIRWLFVADSEAAIAAMITGRLLHSGSLDFTEEEVAAIKARQEVSVLTAPRGITAGVGFNNTNPDLAKKRVREALVLAMDERDIINVAYPGGVLPGSWFPDRFGIPEAERTQFAMYGFGLSREQRLDRAKKILAEEGATNIKFVWASRANSPHLKAGEIGRELLGRIGVQVELKPLADQASLVTYLAKERWDITTFWGGITAFGEPEHFIATTWAKNAPEITSNGRRPTGYTNAKVEELYAQLQNTVEIGKRIELTKQIDRVLLEDVPSKQMGFLMLVNVANPRVKGVIAKDLFHPFWTLEDVWLAPK